MRRIFLQIAYDGTNYHGFQVQPNAETIEGVLNRELSRILKEDITVIGASRTDAGVHAFGNVAVFDTNAKIPGEKVAYALNVSLPEDIKIQHSMEVAPDFHPRYQETVKTYEYKIYNAKFPSPQHRLYEHFTYYKMDVERMQAAANYLIGEHDFKSFCSIHAEVESTVRTIYDIKVTKKEEVITIRITGNGFLYNMVRIIAGTLMDAGQAFWEPEHMKEILEAKERSRAGNTAPAKGLTLVKIKYPEADLEEI
ncbi:MAG: tRNA pseudouridine(38-40) synthase TruA [Lachnospiraceae bacterium]|nr:tRNA pseudouridine(38-40) synthase TruA [Lachnospiraceae bacterium]